MEFSYNYEDSMNRLSTRTGRNGWVQTDSDMKQVSVYSAILEFQISGDTCEILSSIGVEYLLEFSTITNNEPFKIVIPLYSSNNYKQISGGEAMLRHFTRAYDSGRVHKVITPKNEVYYGSEGIVLDGNFNPLIIITKTLTRRTPLAEGFTVTGYTVHVHPTVFTDDDKVLNKSLAKKGMAYYLSHTTSRGPWDSGMPYKVVIDDCSSFFKHPAKPNTATFSKDSINELLKENIGEILTQVSYDSRNI